MSKTMGEVLAEHQRWVSSCGPEQECECGVRLVENSDAGMAAHQAEVLSAAGFGLVADTKAEATREHAAAALRSVDDIWGSAGRQIVRLSEIRESAEKVLNGDWDNHLRWNLNGIAREQARVAS